MNDAVTVHNSLQFLILAVKMCFYLIDSRRDFIEVYQIYELTRHEVRHTDGTYKTVVYSLLQRTPGLVHIVIRPVEEDQVDIVEIQFTKGIFQTFATFIAGKVGKPDFGCHKYIFSRNGALFQRLPDDLLVLIGLCRINETIAALDCCYHSFFIINRIGQHIRTETDKGHFIPRIECYRRFHRQASFPFFTAILRHSCIR